MAASIDCMRVSIRRVAMAVSCIESDTTNNQRSLRTSGRICGACRTFSRFPATSSCSA